MKKALSMIFSYKILIEKGLFFYLNKFIILEISNDRKNRNFMNNLISRSQLKSHN